MGDLHPPSTPHQRSLRYWSGRAPDFSELRMEDYYSPMRAAYEQFLAGWLQDKRPLRVLDAGTGAGFFALLLHNMGCEVTAVDFSTAMLAKSRQNLAAHRADSVKLAQANLDHLPYDDATFDAVVSRNVTWTLVHPETAYREMVRVLRSGGALINIDANYGRSFIEADALGEQPVHPTQTPAQLRERNDLAAELSVSRYNRPIWDIGVLLRLGVRRLHLDTAINVTLGIDDFSSPYTSASACHGQVPFAVVATR